jgi:hypothetical protein
VLYEHFLTKDQESVVWVLVREIGEVRKYPLGARTSHNGQKERNQFETFAESLPKDNSVHRYAYEGEEETFRIRVVPNISVASCSP